jgi:ubiquinone biosynthesis protein UbiJ
LLVLVAALVHDVAPPAAAAVAGDVDCDGDVDSVDALKELRHVAVLPVSQSEPCPDIGSEVASIFGDVDCDDDVDAVDALKILRYVAALPIQSGAGLWANRLTSESSGRSLRIGADSGICHL